MKESDLKRLYLFEYIYRRYKNNMTQKEVAEQIGVSDRTIQNWIAKKNKITSKNFEAILKVFNIDVNIFDENILNKIVVDNHVLHHVISTILNKNDFDILSINKKEFNNDIKYLLNDTLIKVSQNEDYNIPYGKIKEETLQNIYCFIINELEKDYKEYTKDDDKIEKSKQLYFYDLLKSKANLIIYKTLLKGFKDDQENFEKKLCSNENDIFAYYVLDILNKSDEFLNLYNDIIRISMIINHNDFEQAKEMETEALCKVVVKEVENILDKYLI